MIYVLIPIMFLKVSYSSNPMKSMVVRKMLYRKVY